MRNAFELRVIEFSLFRRTCPRNLLPLLLWRRGLGRGGRFLIRARIFHTSRGLRRGVPFLTRPLQPLANFRHALALTCYKLDFQRYHLIASITAPVTTNEPPSHCSHLTECFRHA